LVNNPDYAELVLRRTTEILTNDYLREFDALNAAVNHK